MGCVIQRVGFPILFRTISHALYLHIPTTKNKKRQSVGQWTKQIQQAAESSTTSHWTTKGPSDPPPARATLHASEPANWSTTTLPARAPAMKISSPSTRIAPISPSRSTGILCKISPDWMSMTKRTLPRLLPDSSSKASTSITKALPCEAVTTWG
eukprot:scaffold15971_cov76-Phaeocystis_antarctica.AAC.6